MIVFALLVSKKPIIWWRPQTINQKLLLPMSSHVLFTIFYVVWFSFVIWWRGCWWYLYFLRKTRQSLIVIMGSSWWIWLWMLGHTDHLRWTFHFLTAQLLPNISLISSIFLIVSWTLLRCSSSRIRKTVKCKRSTDRGYKSACWGWALCWCCWRSCDWW